MDRHIGFMALHSHPIVEKLAELRNISKGTALELFYGSDLYRHYAREETKLWHFSSVALADMLSDELLSGSDDLKHTEFVVYCVETYGGKENLSGSDAYRKLKDAGAITYIDENYDALHTFGDENIVWNIDEYLNNHQPKGVL